MMLVSQTVVEKVLIFVLFQYHNAEILWIPPTHFAQPSTCHADLAFMLEDITLSDCVSQGRNQTFQLGATMGCSNVCCERWESTYLSAVQLDIATELWSYGEGPESQIKMYKVTSDLCDSVLGQHNMDEIPHIDTIYNLYYHIDFIFVISSVATVKTKHYAKNKGIIIVNIRF